MQVISKYGNKYTITIKKYFSELYVMVYKNNTLFTEYEFKGDIKQFRNHLARNGFKILNTNIREAII